MTRRRLSEFNYWPGVADTLLATMLLVIVMWFVDHNQMLRKLENLGGESTKCYNQLPNLLNLEEELKKCQNQLALLQNLGNLGEELKECQNQLAQCREQFIKCQEKLVNYQNQLAKCHEEQPTTEKTLLTLPEASGYTFDSGKAVLTDQFKNNFRKNDFKNMEEKFKKYDVDLIEVIGHTDGQPVRHAGNLDDTLLGFDLDKSEVKALVSGSNADLGLVRALAVAQFINEEIKANDSLRDLLKERGGVKFRVYSAAQLISDKTKLFEVAPNRDDPARRRIELRFTKHENLDNTKQGDKGNKGNE